MAKNLVKITWISATRTCIQETAVMALDLVTTRDASSDNTVCYTWVKLIMNEKQKH